MKKHRLLINVVSALLIIVTLEITSPPLAVSAPQATNQVDSNDPPPGAICIVLVIICVVVGVIIWGLIQMCKKIPSPPPPNDGQPTNITIAPSFTVPAVRYMQFQFDLPNLTTNQAYFAGGNVTDEAGNAYQMLCSYNLLSSSNASGPWTLDGTVTNWLGGSMQ